MLQLPLFFSLHFHSRSSSQCCPSSPSSFPYLEHSSSSHPILASAPLNPSRGHQSPPGRSVHWAVSGLNSLSSATAETPSFLASSPGLHGPHHFVPQTSQAVFFLSLLYQTVSSAMAWGFLEIPSKVLFWFSSSISLASSVP